VKVHQYDLGGHAASADFEYVPGAIVAGFSARGLPHPHAIGIYSATGGIQVTDANAGKPLIKARWRQVQV